MKGILTTRYNSGTVRVQDYCCRETPGSTSPVEPAKDFAITYTRTGAFAFHSGDETRVIDNSLLWLTNAGTEHRVSHDQTVRDTCTIFRFPVKLLTEAEERFRQKGSPASSSHSFLFPVSAIPVSPRIDYLHFRLLQAIESQQNQPQCVKIDSLSIRFLEEVFASLYGETPAARSLEIKASDYMEKIERAKFFILHHFDEDISLKQIARNTFISEFHFSRIFRSITNRSPHQYLLDVRFQHALLLLRNTSSSITEICYASGFQNYPHFVAAFTRRYGISPLQFKKHKSKFS
jgi:AraC family transcriptional regulator